MEFYVKNRRKVLSDVIRMSEKRVDLIIYERVSRSRVLLRRKITESRARRICSFSTSIWDERLSWFAEYVNAQSAWLMDSVYGDSVFKLVFFFVSPPLSWKFWKVLIKKRRKYQCILPFLSLCVLSVIKFLINEFYTLESLDHLRIPREKKRSLPFSLSLSLSLSIFIFLFSRSC